MTDYMLLFQRLEEGSPAFASLVVTPSCNVFHSHGFVVSSRIVIYVGFLISVEL